MAVNSKADLYKFLLLFFPLVIFLELVSFLVVKYSTYSINQQVFFGLFGNNFLAYIIGVAVLIILFYLFIKKRFGFGTTLIMAGLVANLLDRIFFSGVIDYLSFLFIPKFNLADVLIILGTILLVYKAIRTI